MAEGEVQKKGSWFIPFAVGLVIGFLILYLTMLPHIRLLLAGQHADHPGGGRPGGGHLGELAGVANQAIISFTVPSGGGTSVDCTQYVGGVPGRGGVLYARPALSESNGDTIFWHGPINSDVVTVTFADAAPYGPFPLAAYTTGGNAPPPNPLPKPSAGPSDYNYQSVQIVRGATTYTCTPSSVQGMGVHVSQ